MRSGYCMTVCEPNIETMPLPDVHVHVSGGGRGHGSLGSHCSNTNELSHL